MAQALGKYDKNCTYLGSLGSALIKSVVHIYCFLIVLSVQETRGRIFSRVWPFYEQAVSDLDKYMHRSLWVSVAHSSFIEGSLTTKNTASGQA